MLPVVELHAATRAQRREMDRDEALLRESLAALPRDSGVVISRDASSRDAAHSGLRCSNRTAAV
jgi:hypothetical protein